MNNPSTPFATLSRGTARAILAALLLLILYGLTTNYQLLIDTPDIPKEKHDRWQPRQYLLGHDLCATAAAWPAVYTNSATRPVAGSLPPCSNSAEQAQRA